MAVIALPWPLAAGEPEHRTPRAGERVVGTLFGKEVVAEERDRGRITYVSLGATLLPGGPDGLTFAPQGGLYLFRAPPGGETRLRAVVAGIANEVRWDRAFRRGSPVSGVVTLDSLTLPWARSDYAGGERLRREELKTYQARVGAGAAWRRPLPPGAVDNGLDVALTVEGGGLWFARGDRTAPRYVLPRDAAEGRLHLRVRADALERNLLELPHRGVSAGLDLVAANRSSWAAWGAPETALEGGGKSWRAASGYAFAALAMPAAGEQHRLLASLHAGIGSGLDRFSAFRLGSGSTWGDFETLSRAVLPSAGVDEIAASRYAIAALEYRYEALFFLYLQLRGTLAWAARNERAGGRRDPSRAPLPAVTAGLTTGLPWNLAAELAGSYGFGLPLVREGRTEKGRFGILVSVTKELPRRR